MAKPKILFIESLYLDQNKEAGITNAEHYLWNTYSNYGGEWDRFSFDEHIFTTGEPGDGACLDKIEEYKPDLIFLDWHLGSNINPTPETLREIYTVRKIPVVTIWWDHVWAAHRKMAEMIQYWVDLNVVVDTSCFYSDVQEPEKYIFLWTPQDKNLYYPEPKQFDIGFYGRIKKPARTEIVERLKADVPDFVHDGGRRESPIPKEEYAKKYRQTAMVVNFSESNSRECQLVGRVMEAILSGCLLLEQKSVEAEGMFRPGIDYVEWENYDDLLEKIRYFKQHGDELKKIAMSGYARAAKYYNSDVWWDIVLRGV